MSIVITRALFCDRCANWYDGGDPLALAPSIRREAAKHGWNIRKGEDVCPQHDEGTASPAPAPGTDKLGRPYHRVDPNHLHGEACAHWTYLADERPGKPTRCRFCGEITSEWCPARCMNEAARRYDTAPAAPQAPAEPTDDPLVPAPGFGVTNRDYIHESDVADYEAEERRIAAESAAREDTAPPDSDGYNSDLTAGFLRPSAPTEEV